jgi:hypothetical protein
VELSKAQDIEAGDGKQFSTVISLAGKQSYGSFLGLQDPNSDP